MIGITNGANSNIVTQEELINVSKQNLALIATTSSWSWGDEHGTADATWFEGLSHQVPDQNWVGKTKSVTLTSAVLGTTTHLIQCIGINQDGQNTVTFQTKNCLANTTAFGSYRLWYDNTCTARDECNNYYNAFPGKNYIKQLIKITSGPYNGDTTETADYVWLPSGYEVGINDYWYNNGIYECTKGQNNRYSYYANESTRVKLQGDQGSNVSWWLRGYDITHTNYGVAAITTTGSLTAFNYSVTTVGLAPAFAIQCNPEYTLQQNNEDVTEDVAEILRESLDVPEITAVGTANPPNSISITTPTLPTTQIDIWKLSGENEWVQKTWINSPSNFYGEYVWTDGENIYYSSGPTEYVLDKSTSTWSTKNWSISSSYALQGNNIWTDGDNIYCSYSSSQYVLDKSTSTWNEKTWNGANNYFGYNIWTDGTNIYWSGGPDQFVLDKSTSTWVEKTWIGLTNFDAREVWTDGENYYYSSYTSHYVLDKSTSTWNEKTWNGLTNFSGRYIWTDGENYYYSNGSSQYVLDKSTSTWSQKTWPGLTSIDGFNGIWTDGKNYYYSYNSVHYVYTPNRRSIITPTETIEISNRNITIATSAPPSYAGSNGDLWFIYDA